MRIFPYNSERRTPSNAAVFAGLGADVKARATRAVESSPVSAL